VIKKKVVGLRAETPATAGAATRPASVWISWYLLGGFAGFLNMAERGGFEPPTPFWGVTA
jgi:hypothetical protein